MVLPKHQKISRGRTPIVATAFHAVMNELEAQHVFTEPADAVVNDAQGAEFGETFKPTDIPTHQKVDGMIEVVDGHTHVFGRRNPERRQRAIQNDFFRIVDEVKTGLHVCNPRSKCCYDYNNLQS